MPPKISYTEEAILTAALQALRESGTEGLTARKIAKKMEGSTQPIYRVFPSIEALADRAAEEVLRIALDYMEREWDPESHFLAIGLGYLRFAREEPELFEFLVTGRRKQWFVTDRGSPLYVLIEKMRQDRYLRDLPDTELIGLFNDMFIYTHGLCTLKTIRKEETGLEQERNYLHEMGGRLISLTIIRTKYPEQYLKMFKEVK